jgi:diaminobutyrate-2-oxoglutarate transaminase
MSVLLIRPEFDVWRPGQHTGTFRGNAHAFVTAAVALRKFWSDSSFSVDVGRRGELIYDRLKEISSKLPASRVKGRGMLRGIEMNESLAARVTTTCVRNGLIIERSGPRDEVVKVLAPLTTPDDVLEHGLEILTAAVNEVAGKPRVAA